MTPAAGTGSLASRYRPARFVPMHIMRSANRVALLLVVHLDTDTVADGSFCSSIAKQVCDENHRAAEPAEILKFLACGLRRSCWSDSKI
jgi:hypothetical protein